MDVDEKLIKHVAKLARLELSDEEIEEFTPQLKEVLETFSIIAEVNTEGISPSFQPLGMKNALRDDKSGTCLTQEQALRNSKHQTDGYFKGPKAM